ncbi:LacI family DNA-binding transcriptional regulator [Burkholderia oklahomensis]|uniref:LacI family DNA-binding transcriptional regulator n=1 Tax=Burkholderia oklahomensis TaxID=342113 RepID=UPI0026521A48|nr:LacI family DNA-binding transcriptional regulator [Burkholderia oklahomensis]MDN7676451.1 LacI family DNA-binding transcriptional regulator [Burkholderia oklahomensis]
MSRVTSIQVAKLAGVSRTTVSFVLNGVTSMGISEETRERVLTAARQLGYVPNAMARSLASGSTKTIALLMPHGEHIHVDVDAYLPRFLAGLSAACHANGYKVIIEPVKKSHRPGAFLDLVDSGRIDGLVVLNPRKLDDDHLHELARNGFPLVVFGSNLTISPPMCAIGVDNQSAAQQATEHLLNLGHERIAHIGFASNDCQVVQNRLDGFRRALEARGLDTRPEWIAFADYNAQSGYEAMQKMLSRSSLMTALFAGNDTIAFGAMAAIRDAGLRIPEDLAVVGYDDIPLAAFAMPPLTTVRTEPFKEGNDAATMLLELIAGNPVGGLHRRKIAPLIVRQSCGASSQKTGKRN